MAFSNPQSISGVSQREGIPSNADTTKAHGSSVLKWGKKEKQQQKKNVFSQNMVLKTGAAFRWISLVWQIPGASKHEYGALKGFFFSSVKLQNTYMD